MGKIGRISPIKREYPKNAGASYAKSLSDAGLTRTPGTGSGKTPFKENNGHYRTGLDPEALYIKDMARTNPEDAKQEQARVKALREELEAVTGLDLGPTSAYYREMFQPDEFSTSSTAAYIKLVDGNNTFNLDNPYAAITFAWLRVHPDIAPSYEAWERGKSSHRCKYISDCRWFVDDEEHEAEIEYKKNDAINKCVDALVNMSPTRQLKVAKLLGLPVSYNSMPKVVYNTLNTYIKEAGAVTRKSQNVHNFEKMVQMADDNLDIRFRIKEAIDFNIYRVGKGGKVYEGEVPVADNEEELVEYMTSVKHQDDLLALQKKIDTAKSVAI